MKFTHALAVAALSAGTTQAAWDSCPPSEYKTWMVSFMQGFQEDPTSTATDCYTKMNTFTNKLELIGTSVTSFSFDDWAAPLYAVSDSSTAATDVFVSCQTTNFAKQLSTRMSTLAGIFDLASTIGVAYLKDYRSAGSSGLKNAIDLIGTSTDCATMANNAGAALHYAFSYQVPIETYAEELGQDLVSEVFD